MTSDLQVIGAGEASLTELADSINIQVKAAEEHARSAVTCALEAGQLLIQAKALVPHGGWDAWLQENCDVAPRTARSYMRLATQFPTLSDVERQRVADLPLRQAVRAIATNPNAPKPGRAITTIFQREARNRVEKQFQDTAKRIRTASKWIASGVPLNGRKVDSLRKTLLDMVAELDRLQGEEGQS